MTEYDLHGVVGIRLEGAGDADVRAVDRQLGPIRASLDRDPDLRIRFVDRGTTPATTLVGGSSGATLDDFVVLRGKHKAAVRVALPIDRIGTGPVLIEVERGAPAVPYLIAIVNLIALANGALPLHASAFVHEGAGVLVTGWSKGGKTEALLAFVSQGATYVGDEWVYLLPDGRHMAGIPEPIRVWDWELAQLPTLRRRIPRSTLARVGVVGMLAAIVPGGRLRDAVDRQRAVDVPPARLFGVAASHEPVRIDHVCFVGTHRDPRITSRPIEPEEVASRMTWSLRYEQLPMWSLYHEYRYLFPDRRSDLLERAPEIQEARLTSFLTSRRPFEVLHPYPVDLADLRHAIAERMAAA